MLAAAIPVTDDHTHQEDDKKLAQHCTSLHKLGKACAGKTSEIEWDVGKCVRVSNVITCILCYLECMHGPGLNIS